MVLKARDEKAGLYVGKRHSKSPLPAEFMQTKQRQQGIQTKAVMFPFIFWLWLLIARNLCDNFEYRSH